MRKQRRGTPHAAAKRMAGSLAALAALAALTGTPALAQDKSMDEIAKYREMLADGNPAELIEMRGEELWKTPRGPKNVSLEQCDLGLGPGKVEGAYAQLPRYFADAGKVMDVEARLVYCMQTQQGFSFEEATKNWYSKPGKESDLVALVTWVGAQSNGQKINVPVKHPKEAEMVKMGEYIFHRRSGPQDFGCSVCHGQDGVRIRLQDLDNLSQSKGAQKAMRTWPAYRVSQGTVWTMQRRLIDCMRQARWPEQKFPSDAVIALEMYLQNKAAGGVLESPGIKR